LDWRAPIITFLCGHYEPVETHDLKRMQTRARGYVLKDVCTIVEVHHSRTRHRAYEKKFMGECVDLI
jgi:hypothetical protein